MNLKNIILGTSVIGSMSLYALFNSKEFGLCEIYCGSKIDTSQNIFLFFPFILLFSLITFRMKEQAFVAWWKFARIAIPIIFLASLYINLYKNPNSGGWFSVENEIDLVALSTMYLIFVIGSAIQVFRGYRQDKTLS